MAREIARYKTPGGGAVTYHHGGLLASLAGNGAWYECTGCGPGRTTVSQWSNEAQADLVDHAATERAAGTHARNCHQVPRR